MKKSELQRVTNFIRENLDLPHARTGNIQFKPTTQDTSTTKTTQDINNIGMQKENSSSTKNSNGNSGTGSSYGY